MDLLIVKNLYLKYNYGALALQNINLEVSKNHIFTILAPTEGGKTSLIKGIAGLYPILRGEIFLNGKDITHIPIKDRNITVMYENNNFFKNKTVSDNLLYPLKIRKIQSSQEKIDCIIEKFNLEKYRNIKIKKLDKQIQFRIALARMFMRKSDLYLLDNPLNVFDESERNILFEYMLPYLMELSAVAPVIYTTDSVNEAVRIDGKATLINYGVQLQTGDINNLIIKPMNLLCYKMFHENVIERQEILQKSHQGVFFEIENMRIYIDTEKLLNTIYINEKVIICYMADENNKLNPQTLRIFDIGSENLIYFD